MGRRVGKEPPWLALILMTSHKTRGAEVFTETGRCFKKILARIEHVGWIKKKSSIGVGLETCG